MVDGLNLHFAIGSSVDARGFFEQFTGETRTRRIELQPIAFAGPIADAVAVSVGAVSAKRGDAVLRRVITVPERTRAAIFGAPSGWHIVPLVLRPGSDPGAKRFAVALVHEGPVPARSVAVRAVVDGVHVADVDTECGHPAYANLVPHHHPVVFMEPCLVLFRGSVRALCVPRKGVEQREGAGIAHGACQHPPACHHLSGRASKHLAVNLEGLRAGARDPVRLVIGRPSLVDLLAVFGRVGCGGAYPCVRGWNGCRGGGGGGCRRVRGFEEHCVWPTNAVAGEFEDQALQLRDFVHDNFGRLERRVSFLWVAAE